MKETVIGLGLLLSGLAMTACATANTPQSAQPAASLPTGVSSRPVPAPGSCHMRSEGGQPLPDPVCTPGAINPDVTPASIGSTICKPGWTATIRPPVSVTNRIKRETDVAYGMPTTTQGELDHLVSLELGGAPADTRNLWVEPGKIPNPKDAVESKLHAAICTGRVTLVAAQKAIATDWTTALVVTGAGR